MDFQQYREQVGEISVGKQLPDAVYLHNTALPAVPAALAELTFRIVDALEIPDDNWNVIKYGKRDFKLSLLNYPKFDEDSYPSLANSFTVDLANLTLRQADYSAADNPPILHRKETFVLDDYPLRPLFESITEEGIAIGLYETTRSIGFKKNWERLIATKGYYLDNDGRLVRKREKPPIETALQVEVERHKTAIERHQLSQPMQILARHNYLDGTWNVLDYGCGRGDDVMELEAHGINVVGWDPIYNPDTAIRKSDIVNLGFVLNVIEDKGERITALQDAWKHTENLLVVAVMVAGESVISRFEPYKDGVLTKRNTFQKYYTQSEIREFIESTINQNPIAVSQGIFFVFRNRLEEQRFLLERQHVRRHWKYKTSKEVSPDTKTILPAERINKNIELFTDYWRTTLDLGRIPANTEFEFSDQIRQLAGSHNKAHKSLLEHFGANEFEQASRRRREDLLVYFALSLFGKRTSQSKMPERLRRDVKTFFRSYSAAVNEATELLFSVGKPETIYQACVDALQSLECGHMEEGHSFIFHKEYLGYVSPPLRVYIGCATQLYGDLDSIHLIKAHIRSGKVTLLRYDDWAAEQPKLLERIKISLRQLEVDFFDHSDECHCIDRRIYEGQVIPQSQ